jgi:protein involved in polysaccharide export with SLBB domain
MQNEPQINDMDGCLKPRKRAYSARELLSALTEYKTACASQVQQLGIVGILAFLILLLCAGCETVTTETFPEKEGGQKPGILAVGDVVKVTFTTAPELNQSQKIGSDGKFSLPLVGDVYAAGKSLKELQDELTTRYKSQLQSSEVIVSLESVAIPVVVSGEVQKAGKIVFERPATVLEAVMEAGGFTPFADLKRVSLIRLVNGEHHTQIFNLTPVLRGKPTRPTYVRAGDVIYVAQKLF